MPNQSSIQCFRPAGFAPARPPFRSHFDPLFKILLTLSWHFCRCFSAAADSGTGWNRTTAHLGVLIRCRLPIACFQSRVPVFPGCHGRPQASVRSIEKAVVDCFALTREISTNITLHLSLRVYGVHARLCLWHWICFSPCLARLFRVKKHPLHNGRLPICCCTCNVWPLYVVVLVSLIYFFFMLRMPCHC